jgi:hypothetical protein
MDIERGGLHPRVRYPHGVLAIDHRATSQHANMQTSGAPGNVMQLAATNCLQIVSLYLLCRCYCLGTRLPFGSICTSPRASISRVCSL